MGLVKEPLDVDFFVMPKTLSERERELISAHISDYKAKTQKRKKGKKTTAKKSVPAK